MGRFNEVDFPYIASKTAIEPNVLVKPSHSLSLSCSNLVAHPVGTSDTSDASDTSVTSVTNSSLTFA